MGFGERAGNFVISQESKNFNQNKTKISVYCIKPFF